VFHISIWGDLELCLGGLSPPKSPRGDGTGSSPGSSAKDLFSTWLVFPPLCQRQFSMYIYIIDSVLSYISRLVSRLLTSGPEKWVFQQRHNYTRPARQ